jgi:type IV pilus assembly protein PilA
MRLAAKAIYLRSDEMKSVQKGFTLIELMIVIAIIGILAAIAIPAYQNYVIRAQATEGSSIIGSLETAFEECYANTGSALSCASNPAVGIPKTKIIAGTYVQSAILTKPGQIQVTYNTNANANIAGKTVSWFAYKSPDGNITWLCNDGASTAKAIATGLLVPVNGGTAATSSANGVPLGSYLPSICD